MKRKITFDLDPIKEGDTFPLWRFGEILTRGRTLREAQINAYEDEEIVLELPIESPEYYNRNHAKGWLSRPMFWLCEALGLKPEDFGHESELERLDRMRKYLAEFI